MNIDTLNRLATLIEQEREALLFSWRQQVRELPSARNLALPVLNDHIPLLLDGITDLCNSTSAGSAEAPGRVSGFRSARSAHSFERHLPGDTRPGPDV